VLEVGEEGQDDPSEPDERGGSRASNHPLLTELIDEGTLEQLEPTGERELRELVRFAAQLDDGEAHTCALAIVDGGRVATDDRKAIRVVSETWRERGESTEPVLRTSDLLFAWFDAGEVSEPEICRILRAVAQRASFSPPREDPHHRRWMELLRKALNPPRS
jgi:hypothetical protein